VTDSNARTITFTPETTTGTFGNTVAGAGDVNNDGKDDFVICAKASTVNAVSKAGACYLIYGKSNLAPIAMSNLGSAGIQIYGSVANQNLGWRVSGVGDINKDNYADVLISSGNFNKVFLVYGGASMTSFTTADSFSGVVFPNPSNGGDNFGYSISRAGDFNHDGYDDLVICSISFSTSGTAFIVYGGPNLPNPLNVGTLTPMTGVRYFTSSGDRGGQSVSGGVDFNLDGFDDIIIGATYTNGGIVFLRGAAYLVFGSASPVDSSVFHLGDGVVAFNITAAFQAFGSAVALAENVGGSGTRGAVVATAPGGGASTVYYFHDVLGTSAPSTTPTVTPTVLPTDSPTFVPSVTPSVTPTAAPSTVPSFAPSFVPTRDPTRAPTATPTAMPSFSPSVIPTRTPTFSPSRTPTFGPSCVPSAVPTFVPTATPIITPTVVPSAIPTFVPSVSPTVAPTQIPSVIPTVSPTVSPTVDPTFVPSVTPTVIPTEVPSVDPTMTPTEVPTVVPSFRPSAPTYSPSAVPTATPTARTKGSIIVNAGLTVNSVNGATLSLTSQETVKQSIANASQTTVNNVDLVSVTRTNRRLLSSVVHRMLATALFSYKVVAEIHFNLIDFPGLNESYVAGTKSKVVMKAVKTHEFDRIISYYATANNASQLLNVTVPEVSISTSFVPVSSSSSEDSGSLSEGQIAGLVIGVIIGTMLLSAFVFLLLARVRSKPVHSSYDSIPTRCNDGGASPVENGASVDFGTIYDEPKIKI
jgi:hypothetical protein